MPDDPSRLRERATQLRDMARYHDGDSHATLLTAAIELEQRADELEEQSAGSP